MSLVSETSSELTEGEGLDPVPGAESGGAGQSTVERAIRMFGVKPGGEGCCITPPRNTPAASHPAIVEFLSPAAFHLGSTAPGAAARSWLHCSSLSRCDTGAQIPLSFLLE